MDMDKDKDKDKHKDMNVIRELSDSNLDQVVGGDGERVQVTLEQYEAILAARMAAARRAGN
jgi:hypothetical protein